LTLANRAVSLDPASDRANVALMMVQFFSGRTEAALAVGNRALALNPNNPEVLAKLALVLYNSGYTQAAASMAENARKDVEAVPRDASLVLSLDAYSRGDFSEASLISEQVNCSDFVVRAVRAASLGEMSSQDAIGRLAYLKALIPNYRTDLRSWMERRRFKPEMIASLEQGLEKAALVRPVGEPVAASSY
jgi:tetratricopeptide (TPR) repeat protein